MIPDDTAEGAELFGDLIAIGRRLSAEARSKRSTDQPSGEEARLTRVDWGLCPAGGVKILNVSSLFTGGHCKDCLIPVGERTRSAMKVRFDDGQSRRYDGVLAQLDEFPAGPTYHLYSERFISLLRPRERASFRWRAVKVTNPTKTTPDLFEIVSSRAHGQVVALRGGYPDQAYCETCGRCDLPSYGLVGELPDWLNPLGEHARRQQPDTYLAVESLPDPPPAWFTFGEWQWGVCLGVEHDRWVALGRRPATGVSAGPLGFVSSHLVEPTGRVI